MQMSQVQGNAAVMEALGSATKCLQVVGESMSVKDITNMIRDYTKESEKMGMKQEMMEDALEMGLDNGEVGADSDKIYSQICDEIGVDYQNEEGPMSLTDVNSGGVSAGVA